MDQIKKAGTILVPAPDSGKIFMLRTEI